MVWTWGCARQHASYATGRPSTSLWHVPLTILTSTTCSSRAHQGEAPGRATGTPVDVAGGIHPRRSVAPATTLKRGCHGWWYDCDMRSAIDSAGRVVIPKPLRARLGLERGRVVEIRERDGRIEIEPASTPMSLARRGGGPVAVPEGKLPPLTDELVRDTIERTRR